MTPCPQQPRLLAGNIEPSTGFGRGGNPVLSQ
jgi:hypothetical protein